MQPMTALKDDLERYAEQELRDFRDIDFPARMRLCGLYFQTLDSNHQWEVLVNLEDNGYLVKTIGKAMAGDETYNNQVVGNTIMTLIYTYLEDNLRDIYNDIYSDYSQARLENADDIYSRFRTRNDIARLITNH